MDSRIKYSVTVFLLLMLIGTSYLKAQWIENGAAICTETGPQYGPQIISDGAGGVIITWYDHRGGSSDIYSQRIDANGDLRWAAVGVAICTAAGDQFDPHIASDGAGGAIIVWGDKRSGTDRIYTQRIDAGGNVRWTPDGVAVCDVPFKQETPQITSDGAGGAIIAWHDGRVEKNDIYVQRVDASGIIQWTPDGVAICTSIGAENDLRMTSDGTGGAIIIWQDGRVWYPDIYAQRIDASGDVRWTADGVAICTEEKIQQDARIISDGEGGAIITWHDWRTGPDGIYAQRIDAGGDIRWAADGVSICVALGLKWYPQIASDGAGGAIITWSDYRDEPNIYAQRIDAAGDVRWAADGVAICTVTEDQFEPRIASDGAGGAIITWSDERNGASDIYAQRIDARGIVYWTVNGVAICTAAGIQSSYQIVSDEAGEAIVAWCDSRSGDSDIYAQKSGCWDIIMTACGSFPTTTAGDTAVSYLIINNFFELPKTLTETSTELGPFSFSTSFKDSLLAGITIDANSFVGTQIHFCPLGGGVFERDAFFLEVDTGDTLASSHFQGEGRALSFYWTSDYLYLDLVLNINDNLIIEETLGELVEVDSLVLYYAVGGANSYQRERMPLVNGNPANDVYIAIIPADVGGSRGMHFYVGAYNGPAIAFNPSPESPVRIRVQVDNLIFPKSQAASKYSMVSFPIDLPGNSIVGVLDDNLGISDIYAWRMFTYISSGEQYIEIPNSSIYEIIQGQSYWLITRDAVTLDTAPGEAKSTPTDSAFVIMLAPGWNMIGNPFVFPVAWDSILVDTITSTGIDTLTMAEARSTAIGSSSPVEWLIDVGYRDAVAILEPFEGYWVENLLDTNVTLRICPLKALEDATGVMRCDDAEMQADGTWMIRIGASSEDFEDRYNYAGVVQDADKVWDRYDCSEPPAAPGNYLSVYFPHMSWGPHRGHYSSDIKGEHEFLEASMILAVSHEEELWGHIWYFDVMKSFSSGLAGDEVLLEFKVHGNVPAEAVVYLIDRHLEKLVDIRDVSMYKFYLGVRDFVAAEEDSRFMLLVGSEEFIDTHEDEIPKSPPRTVLHQNYPNPFNPSTIVQYEIAEAVDVIIRIYDVKGFLVKVLYEKHHKPGKYEISWDGRNDRGVHVTSGIYFYRLVAGDFVQTRKMVLLK